MSSASRTRLYIGKVSSRTREHDLRDVFGKYGYIRHVDVKYGFAFVEFERERDAEEAARRLNDTELDGSRIIVEFSRGGRERNGGRDGGRDGGRRERGPTYGPPQRSDYRATVENLPRDMSWQDLKDHFRAAADVIFADTWHDRYSNRYCGAVEFRSRDDLRRAIRNVDGTEVRGSRIRVFDDSRRSRSRSVSRSPPSRKRRRVSRSRSRSRSPRSPRRTTRRSPSRSPSPSPRRRSPAPSTTSTSSSTRARRSASGSRSPPRSRSPSPRGRSRSPNRSRSPARTRRDDDEPDAKRARRSTPPSD